MESVKLFTNYFQNQTEQREFRKGVGAVSKLKELLAAHKIKLTYELARSACHGGGALIYDTLVAIGMRSIADQPAILKPSLEASIKEQANLFLKELSPMREALQLAMPYDDLIDFAKGCVIPGAAQILEDRNSLIVSSERGLELYRKHMDMAKQLESLISEIKPEYRSQFVEAYKCYFQEPDKIAIEPIDYDSAIM